MVKVSVIVPVYNVEKYLQECLCSLKEQSLKDIEIICVDDGSTDGSWLLLEQIAAEDSRIKLLKQRNQGAGAARNYGLTIAQGEYLAFLDSDDLFDSNMLEMAVQAAEQHEADIVVYRFRIYDQDLGTYSRADYAFKKELWSKEVFSYRDNPDRIFNSFNPCAWNKLFRRDFIVREGIHFQSNKRTNDLFFTESVMVLAERIFALDQELMSYRAGRISNSQVKKNREASLDFYQALKGLKELLEERGLLTSVKNSYQKLVQDTFLHNLKNNGSKGSLQIAELWCKEAKKELACQASREMQPYLDKFYGYSFLQKLEQDGKPREIQVLHKADLKQEPKVSVIVPIYNVEKYLKECLESISRQTLKEIEIICVDDGSTDNSAKVVEEYIKVEPRITYVHQNNGGLSQARNTGVYLAKGRYIYFIDSDDWLKPEALEKLFAKAEVEQLDVLYFDADSFFESEALATTNKGYLDYYHRTGDYSKPVLGRNLFVAMMKKREYRTSVPLHFINRAYYLRSGLSSINGILHEDNAFAFECMLKAKKAAHLSERFYQRRVREDSIVTWTKRFAHAYGHYYCLQAMLETVKTMELDAEERTYVERLFVLLKEDAYKIFDALDESEKGVLEGLDEYNRLMFKEMILGSFVGVEKKQFLPKGFTKVLECYKDNGLVYTLKKIYKKFANG